MIYRTNKAKTYFVKKVNTWNNEKLPYFHDIRKTQPKSKKFNENRVPISFSCLPWNPFIDTLTLAKPKPQPPENRAIETLSYPSSQEKPITSPHDSGNFKAFFLIGSVIIGVCLSYIQIFSCLNIFCFVTSSLSDASSTKQTRRCIFNPRSHLNCCYNQDCAHTT